MKATALDSLSDTLGTLAGAGRNCDCAVHRAMIDGWCGILVAFFTFLFRCQRGPGIPSAPLLGQKPEEAFVEQIERL